MADISIPEGDNPVRYQASLGGNQKYRNMGNVSGQAYLVRGQVTNVYYQKGTLDFNTYGSSVTSGVTDGSGSAPIPVDFWGKNTDGKVFGCYRPVQKGSQILVAYIGGDTSRPIVIGVYPDNEASYELISPVHYNTGDDSTDDVQNDALGERKIYPNQQMMYESGKGDILRSMGGKSFLYISENGSGYLDDINYAYDEIRDFYDADANEIEPTMTKAQSWLLVHEDNESDEASDGHRTRFYVNRSGELMVTFANKDDPNNIVVLEASKDSGFKLTKRFDNNNIKEDSEDYVQFGIGNGNNVSIKSVDSGDATSFYLDNGNIKFSTPKKGSITFDGISVNDLLGKVSDVETVANNASDKADIAARAGETAKSAASEAASQALAASYAGEDAKSAAVNAQAAGEDAKAQAIDTRNRIIYYSSISNEKDVAIPGKYIIVNTDTYIKNGTIKTAHIGDGAITNAKIANLAVGTAQLEDAAITRAKIGNLAVGTAQIEDAAITDAKVGNLSADHLNAGTIDFSVISGIHINASEIDVGKIVADQIFVNGLGDISKNLGTVTSGKITGTNVNDDINTVQSGVNDLNDPNLMSVIEKQNNIGRFAGLTSQFSVLVQNAKDDGIDTTAVTTAYNNLNRFMADILADPDHASDVDRVTYKKYQDAYNEELVKLQSALQNNTNNKFTSAASATSQAASTANAAKSAADNTYAYANSEISIQSTATAKAQSTADNAFSQATTAIDNGKVTSQAVTNLKDGSKLTIAELENGLATKVANSEYASYQTQTASQIASKVDNGDFSTYKTQTADLIASKVANKDFSAYQATTAKAIESKVESKDFNTYKTQTDSAISSKVSKGDANNVNLIPYSAMPKSDSTKWYGRGGGNQFLVTTHAFYHSGADTLYELNTAGSNEVYAISPRFKINAHSTYTFQLKGFASSNVSSMDVFVLGRKNGETKGYTVVNQVITSMRLSNSGMDYRTVTFTTGDIDEACVRIDNNGSTDGKIAILGFTELKLEPGNTATPYVYSAEQSMLSQLSDNINLRVTKDGLISQINIQARNTLISSGGQLTLSGKNVFIDSNDPVTMKSANIDKLLVGKKLTAADISANTFTTNNGTFTVNQNGAITAKNMTLTGGKLSSPTINAGTITGVTINGTTFHGGDVINNQHNTSHFYPMAIEPNGTYKATFYDQMVGLQSIIESGGLQHKFRSMVAGSNGHFVASNAVLDGQGFHSQSGYTSAKDSNFSSSQTITGYVDVTPSSGIYLYGPTQKINFAGNKDNIGSDGITMDSYGNMYGQPKSLYWRIGDANAKAVADIGFDTTNVRDIRLYRNTEVGNLFLGVGHTIGMLDKKPLYFKQGTSSGNMLDIKAGTVYYTGLTKSSLLSVKKDVQKADTAYWAQLVNSIDLATYQYKSDDNTSHIRLSSIVDDVNGTKQWRLPDIFISRDEDGKLCGVDDSVLLNATLATVQEQQKEIDQLNGHNMELEARLNKLEAKLNG